MLISLVTGCRHISFRFARAAFGLTSSYLHNVNVQNIPIYLITSQFCTKIRIWCHIIYGRHYIDQQIMCMRRNSQLVCTFFGNNVADSFLISKQSVCVALRHRRDNSTFDSPLLTLCDTLIVLADRHNCLDMLCPSEK